MRRIHSWSMAAIALSTMTVVGASAAQETIVESTPQPDAVVHGEMGPEQTPTHYYREGRGEAIWQDTVYAAMPCGAPPFGMTSRVFHGVGHCLDRYDRVWAGYCEECKLPALTIICAKLNSMHSYAVCPPGAYCDPCSASETPTMSPVIEESGQTAPTPAVDSTPSMESEPATEIDLPDAPLPTPIDLDEPSPQEPMEPVIHIDTPVVDTTEPSVD